MKPAARRRRWSFVLLEVLVALLILGVAMTAVLRGFMMTNHALRENLIVLEATYLADSLVQDFELEPPLPGRHDGEFADDPRFGERFERYQWELEVEEEAIRYRKVPRKALQDPEPLYPFTLRIIYDDGQYRRFVPVQVDSALLETQLFSDNALQANQLF
jgi:hypothetical protein